MRQELGTLARGKLMKKPKDEVGTTGVSVRLPDDLLARIDTIAEDETRTRGNVIRMLLELGLEHWGNAV